MLMSHVIRQLEFEELSIVVPHVPKETIYSVKIVSISTTVEQGYRQKVVVRENREILGEFIYLPTHRSMLHVFNKKLWHKKLRKIGIKRTHHRYINNLSKRMLLSAYNPKSRRPASKWKKRYELNLKPYIRFQRPEISLYVYLKMYIEAVFTTQNPYTLEFVYDPQADYLKRLSVKPNTTFKDMGLKQFQVSRLSDQAQRKAVYAWKQYLTHQLFKDPA